jgi:hypothetical protein
MRIPATRRNKRTKNGRGGDKGGVSDIAVRDYKKATCASMRARLSLARGVRVQQRVNQALYRRARHV